MVLVLFVKRAVQVTTLDPSADTELFDVLSAISIIGPDTL
jgi:hypothetical protein